MIQYIEKIIVPYNLEANNICLLPPNTTDRLQPLDEKPDDDSSVELT